MRGGIGADTVREVFRFKHEVVDAVALGGGVNGFARDAGQVDALVVVGVGDLERAFVAVDAEEAGHVGAVGAAQCGGDAGGHL